MPRWPAKLMSPVRTSRVTPGVNSAKSMKLRPFTGRFATAVSPTVELTWLRLVSMIGDCPDTVTASDTADTAISIRNVSVCPMVSLTSFCSNGLNPASAERTV